MQLATCREQLQNLTQNILESIVERSKIVSKIQDLKGDQGLAAWSPEREVELVSSFKAQLNDLEIDELFCFSLLIESQVRSYAKSYPEWSRAEHIDEDISIDADRSNFINPVFVMLLYPEKFKKLKIKSEVLEELEKQWEIKK